MANDNNIMVLNDAALAITQIDIIYKEASFSDQVDLQPERDRAFSAYIDASLKLFEDGVICSDDDIESMKKIRQEVEQASTTETLISAALNLIKFLTSL